MWQIASNKTMVLAFLGRKLRDFKQAKPHSTTTHTPNKLTPPFKKARKFLKTWKSVTSSHARVAQNLSDWTPRCSLSILPGCNHAFAVAPLSHSVEQERVFHLPYAARTVSSTSPHWRGFKKHTSLFLFLYTQQTHTLSLSLRLFQEK